MNHRPNAARLAELFRYVLQKHERELEARRHSLAVTNRALDGEVRPEAAQAAARDLELAGQFLNEAIHEYHEEVLNLFDGAATT